MLMTVPPCRVERVQRVGLYPKILGPFRHPTAKRCQKLCTHSTSSDRDDRFSVCKSGWEKLGGRWSDCSLEVRRTCAAVGRAHPGILNHFSYRGPVGASNGRAGGFPKTLGMQQTQYVSPIALEPHTGFRPHAVRYRMSRGCKAGSQVENEVVCDQGDWLSGV